MTSDSEKAARIEVRRCHGLEEFEACMALERAVWLSADVDAVPLPIFVVAAHTGGQVLGAFDGSQMVGFTLALPAFRMGRLALHSHMTAVLAEYRDRGVGRRLKFYQRQEALERGIRLVEWTFDPLELRKAYFNLRLLGAVVRQYLPNHYGITTSPLHARLPTDRFLAEWWLQSRRVERCAKGANEASRAGSGAVRIPVPANIGEVKGANPAEGAKVQANLREEFQRWLGQGYAVVGIEMGDATANYVLEPMTDPERAV